MFFQIFDLLPIQKPDSIPHELLDFSNCLHVRPKRSISGFTNQEGEYAYTVFEVSIRQIDATQHFLLF